GPAAAELLALEREIELPVAEPALHRSLGPPDAAVPEHHGAAPVLTLGDQAFEVAVLERVILRAHREALHRGIGDGSLRHGPAQEHAVPLEAEVVVEPPRRVLLH